MDPPPIPVVHNEGKGSTSRAPPPVPVPKKTKRKLKPPPVPPLTTGKKRKRSPAGDDEDSGSDGGKRRSSRKRKKTSDVAFVAGGPDEEEEEIVKTMPELVVEYLYSPTNWQIKRPRVESKGGGGGAPTKEELDVMMDDPEAVFDDKHIRDGSNDSDMEGGEGDEHGLQSDTGILDGMGDDYGAFDSDSYFDMSDNSTGMSSFTTSGTSNPFVYNRQYSQMVKIAGMKDSITPGRLLNLKSTQIETVPVVHEDTRAQYKAKAARYERDNFVPNREPCKICTYGFTDDIDEESNQVVRDFVSIFLEQQSRVSFERLYESMALHWNKNIVGAFKRIATRKKFEITPSEVEEHFQGGCRFDIAIILRNELEFILQLIDHTKIHGVYVEKVKYGNRSGVVETDSAQVKNLLELYRRFLDVARTQQAFLTNAKFMARYGANPENYSAGSQSYGREFSRMGMKVMEEKHRREQSNAKA